VQAASGYHKRGGEQRRVPWFEYVITGAGGELARGLAQGRNFSHTWTREMKDEVSVKRQLRKIMGQVSGLLEKACGGHAFEDENALPNCSWEDAMKRYILTFP